MEKRVVSTGGHTFALLKTKMVERNFDCHGYGAKRKDIAQAFTKRRSFVECFMVQSAQCTLSYVDGTFSSPAFSSFSSPTCFRVGCQRFVGKDLKVLRRWAKECR